MKLPPRERFFISTGSLTVHCLCLMMTLMDDTGCQGEPMSALQRISEGTHSMVSLGAGDVVIFASRTIPGNEASVSRVQNSLLQRGGSSWSWAVNNARARTLHIGIIIIIIVSLFSGVQLIVDDDETYTHVTGHPCQAELRRLFALIRPRV